VEKPEWGSGLWCPPGHHGHTQGQGDSLKRDALLKARVEKLRTKITSAAGCPETQQLLDPVGDGVVCHLDRPSR